MLGPFIWCELRRLHDAADLTLVHSAETLGELEARGFTLMALWRRGSTRTVSTQAIGTSGSARHAVLAGDRPYHRSVQR
jgi:hypothetical protein